MNTKRKQLHRKPTVKNKYNLTMKDVRQLQVLDKSKVSEPLFWRNNVIGAWCCSGNTARNSKDLEFCTYNSYWIGVYDENAKAYAGKVRFSFDSFGGMCGYKFDKSYSPSSIENEDDLRVQELFLEKINYMIDNKILGFIEKMV